MRLYHDGDRLPHAGRFEAADEEDCYGAGGLRRGIWLTSRPLAGPCSVSVEVLTSRVEEFEVTAEGDEHRTFVVPHQAVQDVEAQPTHVASSPVRPV